MNDLSGSNQHGVWGGYSRDMVIVGNKIDDTDGAGVTIEHGQRCLIAHNSFRNNHTGIELYWDYEANDKELVDGAFGKHHDTSSDGHWILENTFTDNDPADPPHDGDDGARQRAPGPNDLLHERRDHRRRREGHGARGRRGWLSGRDGALPSDGRLSFADLPAASRLISMPGSSTRPSTSSARSARAHSSAASSAVCKIVMALGPDFRSSGATDGMRRGARRRTLMRWFSWKGEANGPRGDLERWRALAGAPLVHQTVPNFLDPFGGDDAVRQRVSGGSFGLIARTRIVIDRPGTHSLSVLSDDGARVVVDGKTVIEDWTWHAAKTDTAELSLAKGEHEPVLEYFQGEGASALSIELQRIGD
jgi:hypothetical protein